MATSHEPSLWFVDTKPALKKDEDIIHGKGRLEGRKQFFEEDPKITSLPIAGSHATVGGKRRLVVEQSSQLKDGVFAVEKRSRNVKFAVPTGNVGDDNDEFIQSPTADVSHRAAKSGFKKRGAKLQQKRFVAGPSDDNDDVPAWIDEASPSVVSNPSAPDPWNRKEMNSRAKSQATKSKEERLLEKLVLGQGDDVIRVLTAKSAPQLPVIADGVQRRRPAWQDEDDLSVRLVRDVSTVESEKEYSAALRNKYVSVMGNPSWADLDAKPKEKDSGDESDDEISHKVGDYIVKSETLQPIELKYRVCPKLATPKSYLGDAVSVRFHPSSQVALVGNKKSRVVIYQVDGVLNSKIQHIPFSNFIINCVEFSRDGEQFIVSSNTRKYYYCYNMMTGHSEKRFWSQAMDGDCLQKFTLSPDGNLIVFPSTTGAAHFVSIKTNEWIFSLQMNSNSVGGCFSSDGTKYYSHTVDGEVYIWDIKSRRCLHKFYDDGCIIGSSLALSPNQQYLACGSNAGVVNFYDATKLTQSSNPKPLKAIMNLTTEVAELKFNYNSEILVYSSAEKDNSLKMFHCKSMTTFKNFPGSNFKAGSIRSLDISMNSGYLAVGSENGAASLFRLNHYGSF